MGKTGVVREKSTHIEVLENTLDMARKAGFHVAGLTYSPITGPEGNIEFLAYLKKEGEDAPIDIAAIVEEAHGEMKGGEQ